MKCPHLFMPLKVGAHVLKNRIVMAPVSTGNEKSDTIGEDMLAFYRTRAKGEGPGLFIIGHGAVHISGVGRLGDPVINDQWLSNAARLNKEIHDAGSKSILQLLHCGAASTHPLRVAASRIYNYDTGLWIHRAPSFVTEHLISLYALQAYGAVARGNFDGVEIAGGGMTFPNTFSTPALNKRQDKWGIDGSMTFAAELVRRVRSFIGPSPILSYRFSLIDANPKGNEWHDILQLAQNLAYEGVNLFSFDIGLSLNSVPVATDLTPDGVWVPFMEKFSAEISVPVIFGKKLRDPEKMDALLERNPTCCVEIARPFIADPHWAEKVSRGETPRPCVCCPQGCLAKIKKQTRLCCVANPSVIASEEIPSDKRRKGREVLVIGGGPAGMAAAKEAALHGMDVTLADENEELGGLFLMSSRVPGREIVRTLLKAQEKELEELGVKIVKNRRVTPPWIEENFNRARIILATGRESSIPDISGIDTPNVLTTEDLLKRKEGIGHRVAVIGSNPIAAAIVRYLCALSVTDFDEWCRAWGIGNPVNHAGGMLGFIPHLKPRSLKTYWLSRSEVTMEDYFRDRNRLSELQWLRMNGANIFEHVKIEQIDAFSVRIRTFGSDSSSILRVDRIILAESMQPKDDLAKPLTEQDRRFVLAGSVRESKTAYSSGEAALDGRESVYRLMSLG
ncbi:MAG: FAD-dependent oxidoreductase [Burkholderia sp.]|jgi:2,4-dienoyl-CoA reductase (NADPH2)